MTIKDRIRRMAFRLRWRLPTDEHPSEDWHQWQERYLPCGEWLPGDGRALCARHRRYYESVYPQGWAYYPGDICPHGKYTGGCGVDLMCFYCEIGD